MLGSLSLLPGLAVAGVTTSVSLAAAMGGVQGLPTEPAKPPVVRVAAAAPADVAPAAFDDPSGLLAAAPPSADPTTAPTSAPTPAPTAPPVHATAPIPVTAAPPPPPPPSNPGQCWSWSGWDWTLTWCATRTGGTWTASNGSTTYSGTTTSNGSWSGSTSGSWGGGTATGGGYTKSGGSTPPGHARH